MQRRPFTWKRFSDWFGKMASSRHVLLERLGHSSKELALSARTALPKENENHFYFTPISICSATHLISISLSLVNFCLVPKLETEPVIKLASSWSIFQSIKCVSGSLGWLATFPSGLSLVGAKEHERRKKREKHLVNIGATATMTTDETSTFSRRSPARAKMRNQLPQKPNAFFSCTVAFFVRVCAVHVMCRDETRT